MLAINMDDVINVLNSCKPYLIALGIALAIAIIVTVACMKLKKPVKKLVRKEAWIAFLMAAVVIINLICGKAKKITPLMYILAVLFVLISLLLNLSIFS